MLDLGEIRRATINDLPKIVNLEQKSFENEIAYNPKQLKYLITRANSHCLIETHEEELRGFIITLFKRGTDVAGIETISVDPLHRGKGIAKKLLFNAEEEMYPRGIRKIRLEVSMENTSAVSLYKKSGYRITSILKNYYYFQHHGTHDAYRMVKEITT